MHPKKKTACSGGSSGPRQNEVFWNLFRHGTNERMDVPKLRTVHMNGLKEKNKSVYKLTQHQIETFVDRYYHVSFLKF